MMIMESSVPHGGRPRPEMPNVALGPPAQPVKVLGDTSQFSMLQTTCTWEIYDAYDIPVV